jgi:hypothetical protein
LTPECLCETVQCNGVAFRCEHFAQFERGNCTIEV